MERRHLRDWRGTAVPEDSDSAPPAEGGGCGHNDNREEHIMATKRPSYLKRLKEQKRNERANEKRDARNARKQAKSAPLNGNGIFRPEDLEQMISETE